MGQRQKVIYQYSTAFKQKIVSEIESGELSISEAQKVYGIKGSDTIQNWIKKLGKNHLLNKIVRIEMRDEKERIKELETQIKKLESALANAHIKNVALESVIECAEEHYKQDLKKNFGGKELKEDESG